MPEPAATPLSEPAIPTHAPPHSHTTPGAHVASEPLVAEVQRLRAELADTQARADHLEVGLRTNRRIGAAIGIVMSEYRLGIDAAFELLSTISQHSNRKVRDLAEDVLHTGTLDVNDSTRSPDRVDRPRAHLRVSPNEAKTGSNQHAERAGRRSAPISATA
jgi:tetrahydromethanopterin S-methyltransferase subunit F